MSTYEKVAVTVGKELQPASHTQVLDTVVVMWNSEFRLSEYLFTVDETAAYHVGFHEVSDPDTYYLLLDDIRIEEVSNELAPAAVTAAAVVPGEHRQKQECSVIGHQRGNGARFRSYHPNLSRLIG